MHAILITFRPEAPESEVMQAMEPKLQHMATSTKGLIMKAFVASAPQRWGGFYLFATSEDADAYLAGEFFQWMSGSPLVSDVATQQFQVLDEPSAAFGTPTVPLATRAA